MGKRAQQAKKRKRSENGNGNGNGGQKSAALALSTTDVDNDGIGGLIDAEDLETALLVLQTLAENPEELAGKGMKDLKRSIYDLHRVMAEGATLGTSLTSKISAAFRDYRFTDALILLFEMYTRKITPKLGAIQRWVRECDATSKPDGTPGDQEAFKCLDMILRIANFSHGVHELATGSENEDGEKLEGEGEWGAHVKKALVWKARKETGDEIAIWEKMQNDTLFDTPPPKPYPNFHPVHHVKAADRRPPNKYDSTVYASTPTAISLTPTNQRKEASKVNVPNVPGAFMVLDVFTPEECLQIVQAAHGIGFELDEAAEGSATMKTSILARNFVWLADQHFLDHFYNQIKPFVPSAAPISIDGNGGGQVRGINARFRVYQYNENQLYRPHIDGAWPAAGLDPQTQEYMHDSSPSDDPLWSRYTLLVYLNSDIPDDTGCTTFFLPSTEMGVMQAHSVKPIQGAVLCFPHGNTQGSLLHEGSAVGSNGGKLVIRTDLLYEARGFGQYKPPASVGVAQGGKGEEGLGG